MKKITMICCGVLFYACSQSPVKPEATQKQIPSRAVAAEKEIKVAILSMDGPGKELCDLLAAEIRKFYGFKADLLKETNLPRSAYYPARKRYRADTLLNYLLGVRPANYDYIIGITDKDISCTNGIYEDWGVFGLGFMPGRSCVISTFRLKKNMKSEEHFRERVYKVVLHELGHNIGLDHCPSTNCLMEDAGGTIKTVDAEKLEVCDDCKEKIRKFKENQ